MSDNYENLQQKKIELEIKNLSRGFWLKYVAILLPTLGGVATLGLGYWVTSNQEITQQLKDANIKLEQIKIENIKLTRTNLESEKNKIEIEKKLLNIQDLELAMRKKNIEIEKKEFLKNYNNSIASFQQRLDSSRAAYELTLEDYKGASKILSDSIMHQDIILENINWQLDSIKLEKSNVKREYYQLIDKFEKEKTYSRLNNLKKFIELLLLDFDNYIAARKEYIITLQGNSDVLVFYSDSFDYGSKIVKKFFESKAKLEVNLSLLKEHKISLKELISASESNQLEEIIDKICVDIKRHFEDNININYPKEDRIRKRYVLEERIKNNTIILKQFIDELLLGVS